MGLMSRFNPIGADHARLEALQGLHHVVSRLSIAEKRTSLGDAPHEIGVHWSTDIRTHALTSSGLFCLQVLY